jgi:hypothetical protein
MAEYGRKGDALAQEKRQISSTKTAYKRKKNGRLARQNQWNG